VIIDDEKARHPVVPRLRGHRATDGVGTLVGGISVLISESSGPLKIIISGGSGCSSSNHTFAHPLKQQDALHSSPPCLLSLPSLWLSKEQRLMKQPAPTASTAHPVLAPGVIQVAVRSSGGDGSRAFVVEAPARGTIADVKRLLCLPPHSLCRDASALQLVLKGDGAFAMCSTCVSRCDGQAASCRSTLRSLQLLLQRA
jgi:hypothetical protein